VAEVTANDVANAFGIVIVGALFLAWVWMMWMPGSKGED